ncbi:HDOD domain-containing protein [Colwellia sp. 1_MG-2023]|uniref:HDOD domain-containing protein n=1 Tax=Colwellia sp. 1_MG-2023 TaxID=3062649 RepID=UPI0026E23BD3|nr:HDOD domain-containing protein [Colwellia sp. 1_MG-2023]MDO6444828.1 HDOD domain-containing protein [Colwellia sp. 1_MG-2023]
MDALDYAEKASEIFVLSDSFIRIKELIDDEASTIDDISDVILIDPALAGTILKLANSSFFNYPGKIDTISKAVLVLGITEVYNLVIAYFTTKAFKSISAPAEFLESFWEQSVDCALMIKYLGFKLGVPNAERLFILGLLHNLGELVIQQFQAENVELANKFTTKELPWLKQKEVLGFTYADCTGELLKLWQLPYNLIEPIRFQNDDDFEYSTMETKLLYIAKRMMLLNRQCKSHVQGDVLSHEKLAELALEQEVIDSANNYCDMERLSILAVLNPSAAMIY